MYSVITNVMDPENTAGPRGWKSWWGQRGSVMRGNPCEAVVSKWFTGIWDGRDRGISGFGVAVNVRGISDVVVKVNGIEDIHELRGKEYQCLLWGHWNHPKWCQDLGWRPGWGDNRQSLQWKCRLFQGGQHVRGMRLKGFPLRRDWWFHTSDFHGANQISFCKHKIYAFNWEFEGTQMPAI